MPLQTYDRDTVIDFSELQLFYRLPIPMMIFREDGKIVLFNRNLQTVSDKSADMIPTLEEWTSYLSSYPVDDVEVNPSLFFTTARSSDSIQAKLTKAANQSVILKIFNTPIGRTTDSANLFMSIAVDISEMARNQKELKSTNAKLEMELTKSSVDLHDVISTLEKEIAERNTASNALTLSRQRLKRISRRTLDILEADRRMISKELHDSIGASLAAVKFSLEEKERNRGNQADTDQHGASLSSEIAYLADTIKETKRISAYLRPSTLDDLGLLATIQWYLRQFSRMYSGITVDYQADISEENLSETTTINLYRIVQEGINNAGKHSAANRVRMHLSYCDGGNSISLLIEDNGQGFDVEMTASNSDPLSGYGLIAMRERCEILGGSFHIDSQEGKGTRLNAILPVS